MSIYHTRIMFLAALLFGSVANAGEKIQIDRSLVLRAGSPSNQFPPGAYQVLRADDGDYIVSGAVNLSDTEAWATRLDSNGHSRWQFIDGPPDAWKTGASNLNRFNGAIVLPDNSTLLCGTMHLANHKSAALLVYISVEGKLIKEIQLVPKGFEQAGLVSCFKWGDGFGLLGVASEPSPDTQNPKFAGWLCKLRFPGTIVWNKFDDNFQGSDVIETPEHDLLIMTSNSKGTKISKVDTDANLKTQRDVSTDAFFMHPLFPASRISVGYMVDTFKTEFVEFDRDLRGAPHVTKANNVGIKKGYALADGSLIVFGSTFRNNAVPNIARIYKDSSLTNFAVAPPMEAGWINDAAADGSPNHYVFVRVAGGDSVMSWVTVHAN
jgi:nucleoside diphosphate kinase